jgi:hypothetical protein
VTTTFAISLGLVATMTAVSAPVAIAGGTTLTAASLTASSTTLTKAETATLTLTVHLVNPGGVDSRQLPALPDFRDAWCPCAEIQVVDDTGQPLPPQQGESDVRYLFLGLVGGTATDGDWSATTSIGAINSGHWQLTELLTGAPGWQPVDGSAYGAVVGIDGADWPVLTIDPPARVVSDGLPFAITGRAVYVDGTPAADIPLFVLDAMLSDYDGLVYPGLRSVVTDSNGRWMASSTFRSAIKGVFFDASSLQSPIQPYPSYVQSAEWAQTSATSTWVRWSPSFTVIDVGSARDLVISGLVAGAPIQLQRKTASGWSAAGHALASRQGAFRFVVHSPGVYRMRVGAAVRPEQKPGTYAVAVAAGYSAAVRVK